MTKRTTSKGLKTPPVTRSSMRTEKPSTPAILPGVQQVQRGPGNPQQMTGSPGVYAYAGRLVSFERKPELQGRNLFVTYDNAIVNTVIVGAAVRYFQALIGGASWTITPKEDAPDGERAAEIIQAGLIDAPMIMPFSTVVKRAALYRYYGFSIHEWAVRRRASDGMIVFANIEHRPQHTIDMWDIPEGGGLVRGVVQLVPTRPEFFYVPRERMFYCVDNTLTDSPDGIGLMRHVIEHSRRLARFEQLEGFGYEGDLRGTPVGRVPGSELQKIADGDASKGDAWVAAQTAGVRKFVQNHIKTPFQGIVLDSATYSTETLGSMTPTYSNVPKWAVDIIKGTGGPLKEIGETIDRINHEIARVLGMEFLLLGSNETGSLALSRDKTSMFASLLEATLSELAWFAMHDLVYPLLELNGIDPEENAPQMSPDPIATERIEAVIAALVGLAQAGAPLAPNDPAINQVRGRLHLADAPEQTPEMMGAVDRQGVQLGPDGKPKDNAQGNAGIAASERAGSLVEQGENGGTGRVGASIARGENGGSRVESQLDRASKSLFRHVDDDTLEKELLEKMIRQRAGKWYVYSADGKKRLGGPYATKAQAVARLRQIEGHKEG